MDLGGYGGELLRGVVLTVAVAIAALAFALVLGVTAAAAKLSQHAVARWIAAVYTTLIRGIPELVLLVGLYYGVPTAIHSAASAVGSGLRLDFDPAVTAVTVLGLIYGAFLGEVLRGAFEAVSEGQISAARALGLRERQTFWLIRLPQMWRFALPGIGNVWLVLLKATALVSVIGLQDVLFWANRAGQALHEPFEFLLAAACCYLVLTIVSERVLTTVERRLGLPQ
jgi:His/Glu/Gln/Arg/opine family amino acid ABC transporter permease subunit